MCSDIYDPTNSDRDSEDEEEVEVFPLPLLFVLTTLQKRAKVHSLIEDTSIVFGRRHRIADFNDSQCIIHF